MLQCTFLVANAQVNISGQVKDSESKEALSYSTVSVFNTKDSLIASGVTNDKGFFSIPLKRGEYDFIFNYLSYQTDTVKVKVSGSDRFLGNIKLDRSDAELAEVVVKGKTRSFEVDKEIKMVTKDMRTGSVIASDVLERVPGITYDRFKNSIKVDGSTNIVLLINGLEKNREYIKNLNPERLDEIEIIRNPSGKYALQGVYAIINIKLKRNYIGHELFISDKALIDADGENKFPGNDISATYNFTYDKVNFYAKYRGEGNDINILTYSKKTFENGEKTISNPSEDNSTASMHHEYLFGVDYFINPRHTLSFESSYNYYPLSKNVTVQSSTMQLFLDDELLDTYQSDITTKSESNDFTNSVFYILNLNKNNKLNASFTHSYYENSYYSDIKTEPDFSRNEYGIDKKHYTNFNIEFDHNFNNGSSINLGYGNSWRDIKNQLLSQSSDNTLPNEEFYYKDIRNKFWAYYSQRFSKKLAIKAGAAAENSLPENNEVQNKSYLIFKPYFDISFKPIDIINISLKYRVAHNYPNISNTTPLTKVVDYQSGITYQKTGNPYLEPENTHKILMKFNILDGLLSIEPYYYYSKNKISNIINQVDDNIIEYTYKNIGEYQRQGIKGNLVIPLHKSVIIQNSYDFFKNSMTYNDQEHHFNNWTLQSGLMYINNKSKTVAGIMYVRDKYKGINAQGYNDERVNAWMLMLQQPMFNKKLSIMIAYIPPINYGADYITENYTNTGIYEEYINSDVSLFKNIIVFKITYRFNKGKSIKEIYKNIEKDSEKQFKGLF